MKTKFLLSIILCLCISISLNAQDPTQKILQGLMGGKKKMAENVQDTYAFEWEFKTNMKTSGKKKSKHNDYNINFYLNTHDDYYGMDSEIEGMKDAAGEAVMVFDFKTENMIMFGSYNGQKMGMLYKLKNPLEGKIKESDKNFTYKEIGTKTILGYECYGMEVENKNNLARLWFTLDAPVNFSAFFAFSGKNAPKGFSDPQLFDVLKDEALLMEMEVIGKKKNETMTMTAISLEKKNKEFHKKDYQFMRMGF